MQNIKKLVRPVLNLSIALLFFSCGNKEVKTDEAQVMEDSSAAAAPAFTPYKVIVVKHPVANFEKWKTVYDGHDSVRKAFGITNLALLRGMENPKMIMVVNKFEDLQKAREFSQLPNLKETMQKAGVTGAPEFAYYDVIRDDESEMPQMERMMVTHHVKDFDAWLKVYDAEGKAKRMEEGFIDRVMARSIADPNIVHLVFAVTDMAKAKASIASEEKKKIMTEAGVDGPPDISFYTLVK